MSRLFPRFCSTSCQAVGRWGISCTFFRLGNGSSWPRSEVPSSDGVLWGSHSKCSIYSCVFYSNPSSLMEESGKATFKQRSQRLSHTTAMSVCSQNWRDPGSAARIPSQTQTAEEGLSSPGKRQSDHYRAANRRDS